ncbi:MAG: protease inhibitor I42 family protein [Clostridia bacterium]
MNKKKLIIVLVIAFLLTAIGAGAAIGMTNINRTSDEFTLKPGQLIDIKLDENPSTGYSWSVSISNDSVVEVARDYFAEGLPIIGGGGEHIWKIRGLEKGVATLTFSYSRSWEENSTIEEKTFTIKVK